MRLVAAITLAALLSAAPAHAHGQHHHLYAAHHHRVVHTARNHARHVVRRAGVHHVSRVASSQEGATVSGSRPRDCWGIPWCGCFLKHYLHIPIEIARKLNLNMALSWLHVGTPASGPAKDEVVVWNHGHGHGHVGVIASDHPDRAGRWLVTSGNDGHAVRTRWRYVGNAAGFRKIASI